MSLSALIVPPGQESSLPSPRREGRRIRCGSGGEEGGTSGSGGPGQRQGGIAHQGVQHGHGVGGLAEGGQDLEQPCKRRVVPDEQPGRLSQGPDALPASVAFSTCVRPLLGLDLGQFLALGGDVLLEALGAFGGTFLTGHTPSPPSWQVYVICLRIVMSGRV